MVVAHVTRAPAVLVENGQVTPGSAAGQSLNLWNRFRVLVPDDHPVHVTHEVVVAGRVSAGIVGTLEKFGCDLVEIGSHGHGRLRRLFRGSLTDEVVRELLRGAVASADTIVSVYSPRAVL